MKTVRLIIDIEVPDEVSHARVEELTDMLLEMGLEDAEDTLDDYDDEHDVETQNIKDCKEVLSWNFCSPK